MKSTSKLITILNLYLVSLIPLIFLPKLIYAQESYTSIPSEETVTLLPDHPGSIPILLNWDYNVLVLSPKEIANFVLEAKEADIQQINFRISNKGVINARIKNGTVYTERLDAFGIKYDPLKILVKECHKQGLKVGVYFDLFESSYDSFFKVHPQYTAQAKKDTIIYNAFPSYADKETRRYLLSRVRELAKYGIDQMFFCTKSSHTPRNMTKVPRNTYAVYNLPVVKRYQEKYGVNILKKEPDKKKVAKINGEYIIKFLKSAKNILHQYNIKSIVGATLSGYLQPSGKNIYLDWKSIVHQKAADALVMANSRKETLVWYHKDAPQKFWNILRECKKNGLELYGYVISDGVHTKVAEKASWSGLLHYISKQMQYFYELGADGVLIHDADLIPKNPFERKALWTALGNWNYSKEASFSNKEITVPRVDSLSPRFSQQVPQGGFEERSKWYWYIAPSWFSDQGNVAGYSSWGRNRDLFQKVWAPKNGSNAYLKAEYDWKVMANSKYSGRSYYGRSSMLVYAELKAGQQSNRTVSWNAKSSVPIVPADTSIISVEIHGENLAGIKGAGMDIKIRDKKNRVIDRLEKQQAVKGTFSWRQIKLKYKFPPDAYQIEVSLYLKVAAIEKTRGRLWFDKFSIQSVHSVTDATLQIIEGLNALEGNKYASLQAKRGIDMVSMPFKLDLNKGKTLQLSMRTKSSDTMKVMVKLGKLNNSKFKVRDKWQNYTLPIANKTEETFQNLVIRPLTSGEIYIDNITIH